MIRLLVLNYLVVLYKRLFMLLNDLIINPKNLQSIIDLKIDYKRSIDNNKTIKLTIINDCLQHTSDNVNFVYMI